MKKYEKEELLKDLRESEEDIFICILALRAGIVKYSGGLVENRLITNMKIIQKIKNELKRRENSNA